MLTQNIADIDRILDDLESRAREDSDGGTFLTQLSDRLRLTLDAEFACIILPLTDGDWQTIASSGIKDCGQLQQQIQRSLTDYVSSASIQDKLRHIENERWLAVPINPSNVLKGFLVVAFDQPIPPGCGTGFCEIVAAFSEIVAIRQACDLESFLDNEWRKVQILCRELAHAPDLSAAAMILSNDLRDILGADRVSVLSSGKRTQLQAVSSVPRFETKSDFAVAVTNLAQDVVKSRKPIASEKGEDSSSDRVDQLLPNRIAIPLNSLSKHVDSKRRKPSRRADIVVVEFRSQQEFRRALGKLTEILPNVGVCWEQQRQWLNVPRLIRGLVAQRRGSTRTVSGRLAGVIALTVLSAFAAWFLSRPYPLIVEAKGTYEPVVSRTIFATHDGFVHELLVEDGMEVKEGDTLVALRSPDLEILMEQTQGELLATVEEINSLQIAMNQLDPNDGDVLLDQSRLAGKIEQTETRQRHIEARLTLLKEQQARLTLKSPIDGVVMAKDIIQELAGRPIRRGDALLSVANTRGDWMVKLHVADRDFGYVRNFYSDPARSLDFTFDRSPDAKRLARVSWMNNSVENTHGSGTFVEVRARTESVDKSDKTADTMMLDMEGPTTTHSLMGAGVTAYLSCGEQPLWFVWCRPLIEAAQRRMWF